MDDIGKVMPTKPIWPRRPGEEPRPPAERERGEHEGERDEREGEGDGQTPEQPQTPGEGPSDGHIDVFV